MSNLRSVVLRSTLALVLLASIGMSGGCTKQDGASSSGDAADEQAGEEKAKPEGFSSWVISINDEDSYTEGDITYTITLDLTATNPSQSIDGAYSGSATAKTTTTGVVEGMPLNASASVNSSSLEFTLADQSGTGSDLGALTSEDAVYSGTGSIVMAASGSGTVGPAGGSFSNTSGQQVEVRTQGSAVTFSVVISGHTYVFEGTLAGQP